MTTGHAIIVKRRAWAGFGWCDICAELQIKLDSADGLEIRRYVLALGGHVEKRHGT